MTGLVGPDGLPLASSHARPKKVRTELPKVGVEVGSWAGRDTTMLNLPGGGVMQFDLSRLTLSDYRAMRNHYQLSASLLVLTFLMHQIDWSINCEKQEIKDFLEEELKSSWTPFIRGISQAFWAGYGPCATEYHHHKGYARVKEIKDLVPEECNVKWRKSEGWAPPGKAKPLIYHYDGLYQNNQEIPSGNTLWYPIFRENGDYYGKKLLKPAFPAWFFSQLMHMYANRYFERFGEPLPVGRYPEGSDVDMGGGRIVSGKTAMETVVRSIRNRSAVTLPSDHDEEGNFDYTIEYLESQMRGADFERYMSRLDEEMSLALFTPVLLFRTADVGSYNLGQQHMRVFQQMLNALAGDIQYYLQNYLLDRLRVLNFGENSPPATWEYRKQGLADLAQYKEIMVELIRMERAMPNLEDLAQITGMTWAEAQPLVDPADEPDPTDENGEPEAKDDKPLKAVARRAVERAASEFANGRPAITLGFRSHFEQAAYDGGWRRHGRDKVREMMGHLDEWIETAAPIAEDTEVFRAMMAEQLDKEIGLAFAA